MHIKIELIVGLGNPGPEYDKTRHNAGAWLLEHLAEQEGLTLRAEKKFHGLYGKTNVNGHNCHLLLPTTYMNHSGQAVKAVAKFYKIPPEAILIAHDELDMPAGVVKLKQGGGHGGHNGLRDIVNHLGSKAFNRARIGIGHPGHKDKVLDYVLQRPSRADGDKIHAAIDDVLRVMPSVVSGELQKAMQELHT